MPNPVTSEPIFAYRCPDCDQPLTRSGDLLACAAGHQFRREDDIWRLITDADVREHTQFMRDYAKVREAEGWARPDPFADEGPNAAYYLALPNWDISGYYPQTWRRRRLNYNAMVAELERGVPDGLRILDLGAGNCWLSRRLAERGHEVCALDLSLQPADGLATARVYFDRLPVRFARVQADMTSLPLQAAQFDAVIAADSLHYAADLPAALQQAGRVLKPGGVLIVTDSPFYPDAAAGDAAISELIKHYHRFKLPVVRTGYFVLAALQEQLTQAGFSKVDSFGEFSKAGSGLAAWWGRLRGKLTEPVTYPIIFAHKEG